MRTGASSPARRYHCSGGPHASSQTGQTSRRIALELQRLYQVTLTGPDVTVQQTTPPSALAQQILAATAVKPPARITAITPA
jgi:hypothetical protein